MSKIVDKDLAILSAKNWEAISENKEQKELMRRAEAISQNVWIDAMPYEEWKKEIAKIQKEVNAYDAANIKPIKQLLLYLKDKVVGEYQKWSVDRIKKLKKDTEEYALQEGILIKEEKPVIRSKTELELFLEKFNSLIEKHPTNFISKELINMMIEEAVA